MDQEFINQLAEKLSKLGTKRPLGFHYAHPFGTVPPDSIQCNGAEYNRALYADFFAYATEQGWIKTEAEWQEIASQNNGYCAYYSDGNGSTTFRTPKFAPFMQVAIASSSVGDYHEAGIPNITGTTSTVRTVTGGFTRATGAFNHSSSALNLEKLMGGTYASTANAPSSSIETFDASRESAVYGKSATVQPESSEWMICVVVFGVATNVGSTDVSNVLSAVAQVQSELPNKLNTTTPHIVDTWKSGSNWYRKWSDGWIEQGGYGTSATGYKLKISFAKSFSDTKYVFVSTPSTDEDHEACIAVSVAKEGRKKTSCTVFVTWAGGSSSGSLNKTFTYSWYAAGY